MGLTMILLLSQSVHPEMPVALSGKFQPSMSSNRGPGRCPSAPQPTPIATSSGCRLPPSRRPPPLSCRQEDLRTFLSPANSPQDTATREGSNSLPFLKGTTGLSSVISSQETLNPPEDSGLVPGMTKAQNPQSLDAPACTAGGPPLPASQGPWLPPEDASRAWRRIQVSDR